MSITEENFKEAILSYNYRGRNIERRMCNRLRNGKCEYRFRTSDEYNNFKLTLNDKAGNSDIRGIVFLPL